MVEYEDDDPTRDEGPIVVRRVIRDAARAFEKTLGPGAPGAIGEAQDRMDKAHAAGKVRAESRWREIYRYLMTVAGAARGAKTVILEAGEGYDFENDKVIRRGKRQPRSGKGS